MARKANSTFMPVLALVSMKGTPYSCQGESVGNGPPPAAPPPRPRPATGSHLLWPASLRPLNGSPSHCSHPPVKPKWVIPGKEALTPTGTSPAPPAHFSAPGSRHCLPSAGGLWDCGRGAGPGARASVVFGLLPSSQQGGGSLPNSGRWVTLPGKGVVTSLKGVTVVEVSPFQF